MLLYRGTSEVGIPVLRDQMSRLTGHVWYNSSVKRQRDATTVKLRRKHLDSGILSHKDPREAMGSERSRVMFLDCEGRIEGLPELSKEEVAERIVDWVGRGMGDGTQSNR